MSDLALNIENLSKTYGSGFTALKSVSLEVPRGDFYALLGPNGAGKSTFIGIVSSLVNKTSGHVEVMGYDLDAQITEVKKQIGLVPQEFNFNQFEPVQEIVINQAGFYGIPRREAIARSEKYLKKLDLWAKRDVESRALSGGMKRRLMIARALVHEPCLLILDEPTAGVDIEIRRSMWEFLREINQQGTTIILTTHYLEEAESLCRNIGIINHGEIVENSAMSDLLDRMHCQTFVVKSRHVLHNISGLEHYAAQVIDNRQLELTLSDGVPMNQLFNDLSAAGVEVMSLRNKQNRLEQLFMEMVTSANAASCEVEQN